MGHIGTDLSYYSHSFAYFNVFLQMKTSLLVISVENQLIVRSPSEQSEELRMKSSLYINEKSPRRN